MTWDDLDWKILERLRRRFLDGTAGEGPYWTSEDDLRHYDFTYAERIGWKWDAVLRELALRGWAPRGGSLLDWGCGSGVAGRRALSAFGAERFDSLLLWDHSPLATDYAATRAALVFPGLNISPVTPGFFEGGSPIGLLVVSHVLSELSEASLADLRRLVLRSETVLWVEPGSKDLARGLQTIRDSLTAEFRVVAPCTHTGACPLLAPDRERDWCHFFAPPPLGIHADSNWVKFGQRAGIDLRSLPYSFLALQRRRGGSDTGAEAPAAGWSRVIGRPEFFKPYARLLSCGAEGAEELTLPKRAEDGLFKRLEKAKGPLIYRWRRDAGKIVGGEELESRG